MTRGFLQVRTRAGIEDGCEWDGEGDFVIAAIRNESVQLTITDCQIPTDYKFLCC